MAEVQSIFANMVRLRWPEVDPVFGVGRFAILSRCPARPFVRLFETAAEAQAQLRAECGHAFCKSAHTFVRLDEQPPAPAPRFIRKPHWARDLDRD